MGWKFYIAPSLLRGRIAILIIFLLASCGPKTLAVQDAWARPGDAGNVSAIYLTIYNGTDSTETLLSVHSDVAEEVAIHMTSMDDQGVLSMHQQENIEIPAGVKLVFEPGGYHIMLTGLKGDLNVGDTFMLQLEFQNAGEVQVEVEVRDQ